jgi:hypothetical protein
VACYIGEVVVEYAKREETSYMNEESFLKGVAIAIPVIVAILVVGLYLQRVWFMEARFTRLIERAAREMELALSEGDREHWQRSLESLTEALELKPGETEVAELLSGVQRKLDEIDRVYRLPSISKLWEYDEAKSLPRRVIVRLNEIYVLDKGTDRVYKHVFNEAKDGLLDEEVIVSKGSRIGDILVGELIDIVWVTVGEERHTEGLLILESGYSLLEYNPTLGRLSILLDGRERWRYPSLVASYNGRFYLLDVQSNQILRYKPTPDGYSEPPEDYFKTSVDLGGVVDIAIDGSIYLLYADGTILKFFGGEPISFELKGLGEPLKNSTSIFTDEQTNFLYVADPGTKRILQLRKDGELFRQFKLTNGDALEEVNGLFVDEVGGKLYILSGKALYLAEIPSGASVS